MGRLPNPSNAGRALSLMRKTFAGGAPRSDAPRCPCDRDTLARAQRRASKKTGRCPAGDGHKPPCPFAHPPQRKRS